VGHRNAKFRSGVVHAVVTGAGLSLSEEDLVELDQIVQPGLTGSPKDAL
jgi:hypothetical protein